MMRSEEVNLGVRGMNITNPQDRHEPLPPPPKDPLVRPRGLPILVPRNLTMLDMPSNLPKFWGTKDGDPSRHTERYI